MTNDERQRLDDLIEECQEITTENAQAMICSLECVETVEVLNDAEANIAEALSEARKCVVRLETLTRSFAAT